MTKPKLDIKSLPEQLIGYARRLRRYSFISFLLLVAVLYGFLLLRINTLSNEQPSEAAVSGQVKDAQIPYIDQSVVKQLQSLEDNSVSVEALFNQARDNPFQE